MEGATKPDKRMAQKTTVEKTLRSPGPSEWAPSTKRVATPDERTSPPMKRAIKPDIKANMTTKGALTPDTTSYKWATKPNGTTAAAPGPDEGVRIHFINVGQGDCILVEFYDTTGKTTHSYLIDGGLGGEIIDPQDRADNRNTQHSKNKLDCLVACNCPNKLDGIIVSHPDQDHFAGVTKILKKFGDAFKGDILITEQFRKKAEKENKPKSRLADFLRQVQQSTKCDSPVTIGEHQIQSLFGNRLNCFFHETKGVLYTTKQVEGRSQPTRGCPSDGNITSIITSINDHDAVLTADSTSKVISEKLQLKRSLKHFKIFQVPHHGSKDNSNRMFYEMFTADIYVISAGNRIFGRSKEGHPNSEVLQAIIRVNTERKTKCAIVNTNSYGLSRDKLLKLPPGWWEWVTIYHADALVDYRDGEAPRSQQWVTVDLPFNQTHRKELELLGTQLPVQPVYSKTADKVGIKIEPNSLLHTVKIKSESMSDTEKVKSKKSEDISSNSNSPVNMFVQTENRVLVEWTPQGYIDMIRHKIKTSCRTITEKPTHTFHYKLEVEIKSSLGDQQEKDSIIAVPVPHQPWSGDSLNLCYVQESTLDTHEVRFLRAEAPIWRKSEFQRFTYFSQGGDLWKTKDIDKVTLQ